MRNPNENGHSTVVDVLLVEPNKVNFSPEKQWAILSEAERQRAMMYRFQRNSRQFVFGRSILKLLVAKRLRVKPELLVLTQNEFGKPILPQSKLFFNVSHSGDLVAIAFSSKCDVGIDIESKRPICEIDAIVSENFDLDEKRRYFGASQDERNDIFLDIFTKKEACLKSIGFGLTVPLRHVHTLTGSQDCDQVKIDKLPNLESQILKVNRLDLPSQYIGAIATEKKDISIRYENWSANEFIA